MTTQLDQAIAAAQVAEATYDSDVSNVTQIQSAIQAATTPLAPAQAQLATDTTAYVAALQGVVSAAQAEIAALTPTSGS